MARLSFVTRCATTPPFLNWPLPFSSCRADETLASVCFQVLLLSRCVSRVFVTRTVCKCDFPTATVVVHALSATFQVQSPYDEDLDWKLAAILSPCHVRVSWLSDWLSILEQLFWHCNHTNCCYVTLCDNFFVVVITSCKAFSLTSARSTQQVICNVNFS